jgi:hypothetical protein
MKETYYFTHDYNARSDSKIKNLIRGHQMLGYGIYWAIIEDLYQNNNVLPLDCDLISYELRVDTTIVKSIIEDFELFVIKDNTFGSSSVEKRLLDRDKKSKTAQDNARKRWGVEDKRITASLCMFYIIRLSHEDEHFIKCGITTESISRRYSGKTAIYTYTVLYQQDIPTNDALQLEIEISKQFKKYSPKRTFGGYLECYSIEQESDIINFAMQRECKGNAIKESKEEEKKEDEKKFNFSQALLSYGFDKTLVSEWLEVRRKKKAVNTETAYKGFITEVEKTNLDKNKVLQMCVEKSWQGFTASWIKEDKPNNKPANLTDEGSYS